MGRFLFKMERKYGQYAIRDLSLIMVICYAVGYLVQMIFPNIINYLTLNPYYIFHHGQVWRLVSWILIPPGSFDLFTLLLLFCYYSIGKSLEAAWGDFKYNVFMFSGFLFTILGAFIIYGIGYLQFSTELAEGLYTAEDIFTRYQLYIDGKPGPFLPGASFMYISTYYVTMSSFLAFAFTFPESRIFFMFFIPIRAKMLGWVYVIFLVYKVLDLIITGQYYIAIIMVLSLLNFVIFFFSTRDFRNIRPSQLRRRQDYRRKVQWARVHTGQEAVHEGRTVITRHKCAVCGRTELDGEDIEFRYCSKCDGNYEYCSTHIYTHEHIKRI